MLGSNHFLQLTLRFMLSLTSRAIRAILCAQVDVADEGCAEFVVLIITHPKGDDHPN